MEEIKTLETSKNENWVKLYKKMTPKLVQILKVLSLWVFYILLKFIIFIQYKI